jgi:hypothetical protein
MDGLFSTKARRENNYNRTTLEIADLNALVESFDFYSAMLNLGNAICHFPFALPFAICHLPFAIYIYIYI